MKLNKPVIFDVGYHWGGTILEFNKLFRNSVIFGFEPMPNSFDLLKNNTKELSNIHCFQYAVSDRKEDKEFFITNAEDASSLNKSLKTNTFIDNHTNIIKSI